MVTFLSATVRATPARNAVKPARAPDDRSRPASGIFHRAGGDIDDAPEFALAHRVDHFWINSTATTMLAMTPSIICARVSSRKFRIGGPPLLFTRISGSGQAASSAF